MYYLDPVSYTLWALVTAELGDNDELMQVCAHASAHESGCRMVRSACRRGNACCVMPHGFASSATALRSPLQDQEPPVTVSQFVESYFGYRSSDLGWLVAALAAFPLAFFASSTFALWKFKWQNR
jgi:hypothetical protein